jgi:hypothetical protein
MYKTCQTPQVKEKSNTTTNSQMQPQNGPVSTIFSKLDNNSKVTLIKQFKFSSTYLLKIGFVGLSFGGFIIGATALIFGQPKIYEYWSHFGAGPMKLNGHIFLFGDLAHLTSAAACSSRIEIGVDVCDPWGRLYNQNPLVGKLFRYIHLCLLLRICLFALGHLMQFYLSKYFSLLKFVIK